MSSIIVSREDRTIMMPGDPVEGEGVDGVRELISSIKGAIAIEIDYEGCWRVLIMTKDQLEWMAIEDTLPTASKKKYLNPPDLAVVKMIK